jgi:hypothetical protein
MQGGSVPVIIDEGESCNIRNDVEESKSYRSV